MKIIVTTSNRYLHLMPVFSYLFKKYWPGAVCEVAGYEKPVMPKEWNFVSMGEQGPVEEWSTDLRRYFETQDQWFIWLMEDTFIRGVDHAMLKYYFDLVNNFIGNPYGRINLTDESRKQEHVESVSIEQFHFAKLLFNTQGANYRLSTQPSIWNRDFLLKYMTDGLSPWKFETQSAINDGYEIIGLEKSAILHNEGVRKHDIYDLNLDGLGLEDITQIHRRLINLWSAQPIVTSEAALYNLLHKLELKIKTLKYGDA